MSTNLYIKLNDNKIKIQINYIQMYYYTKKKNNITKEYEYYRITNQYIM